MANDGRPVFITSSVSNCHLFPMAKFSTKTHSMKWQQASVFLFIFEHTQVVGKFWDKIELPCGLERGQFNHL